MYATLNGETLVPSIFFFVSYLMFRKPLTFESSKSFTKQKLRLQSFIWVFFISFRHMYLYAFVAFKITSFKLRSSMTSSNRPLRATVGQNSSSVQIAAANHVGAAVLVHVARSGRLDDVIDERSFTFYVELTFYSISDKIAQILFTRMKKNLFLNVEMERCWIIYSKTWKIMNR